MLALLFTLLSLVAAHNGTCPSNKKCGAETGEGGRPCCQITSSSFECCSSSEACIPKVGCRCATRNYESYSFQSYCSEFSKSYGAYEAPQRQKIFEANLQKIQAHNAEYQAGKVSWYMAVNQFADWSQEEFQGIRSTKYQPSLEPMKTLELSEQAAPGSMDWRTKGVVTAVKNQGGCGSCWAFSATETVESQYAIASGKLLTLAPQTYVNCVQNPKDCGGTGGCEGATMELAFNLTISKGIALESDLPYKGKDETCQEYRAAVKALSYVRLPINDASALEQALATRGPVSVTVAALSWQLYGGGIFTGCNAHNSILDHGVQAVGYTKDYWLIRNSWGTSWGEEGYIRLTRATDDTIFIDTKPEEGEACKPYPKMQKIGGQCGVLFDTSLPVGVTAADSTEVVV